MSIATGRDSQAYNLLSTPPSSVRIAIPSICCMEALSALEEELKRRNRFENELNLQISQLRRDVTSPYAKSLLFHVRQSVLENRGLLNDIKERLFQALDQLAAQAEIIALTANMLQTSLNTAFFEKEPTDNLILYNILQDASVHPTEVKVFLSGNVKEFGALEVQQPLRDAGVEQYFRTTESFLGWLNSQSTL
ncbi:PIN domain-containing protein [Trichocoleus sp. ST-U3]